MRFIDLKRFSILIFLFALLFLVSCTGLKYYPKDSVWYHPPELAKVGKAMDDAEKSGKCKKCPVECREAREYTDKVFETYRSCRTKEAIQMSAKAMNMIKALCPLHPKKEEKILDRMTLTINFEFDKAEIREDDMSQLRKAIKMIKKYPKAKVRLIGHTCSIGTDEYNQSLSVRRAVATKQYLIKETGISKNKISAIGYGETKPAYSNSTKEGREKNRRVEVLVIEE